MRNNGGAHNLFFITDPETHQNICGVLGTNYDCLSFAVGGQFKGDGRRKKSPGYDGIFLYALRKFPSGYQVERVSFLADGTHDGIIEKRKHFNGVGEFDGQSALIFYNGAFRLFAEMPRLRADIGVFSVRRPPTLKSSQPSRR